MSERNVPNVRFQGFCGEWETQNLGELAIFSKGNGFSKSDLVNKGYPIILYGRLYTKYETIISEVDTFIADNSNAIISKGNEVIVPASGETAEDISRAAVVEKNGIVLGGDLNIIYPNENILSAFLAICISNGTQQRAMMKRAQGKSVVHLHNSDLCEVKLTYPSEAEQAKIGEFFKNLDNLIAQNQKKYDKLVNMKKACLDKMFPKDGADNPEVRFKGFSGEWEEKTLADIALITTGYPFNSKSFDDNGEYLVITNGNIQSDLCNVDISIGNHVNISNAIINDYVLKVGDILVTMDGTVGRTAKVLNEKLVLAQRVGRITTQIDNEFLYQLLNTYDFFENMKLLAHGGTIKHISLHEIGSYKSKIPPDLSEQTKIGTFFQNLDKLITLQKTKLDKLKNIKKACLDKMFI